MSSRVIIGDCRAVLPTLEAGSVQTCVTSPPYWGLRDYGHAGQIGLEPTPAEYVAEMVAVFREVRRVLRDDGTLWLNLGDSYNAAGRNGHGTRQGFKQGTNRASAAGADHTRPSDATLKPKDLVGIPWRVAFALQADGWYLRSEIIWHKLNPMPESVRDRPTKAHEQIFLLSKNEQYFYDADAIAEKSAYPGDNRAARTDTRKQVDPMCMDNGSRARTGNPTGDTRNKRSVWTVATQPFKEAHFATFPPALIEPCILAGSKPGDAVLDPFGGSGTTGQVAEALGRKWTLIELSPEYEKLGVDRTRQTGMELVCGS